MGLSFHSFKTQLKFTIKIQTITQCHCNLAMHVKYHSISTAKRQTRQGLTPTSRKNVAVFEHHQVIVLRNYHNFPSAIHA